MWIINGQAINRQRNFTDGNGNRQRGIILVKWTKEALAEIGVKPFREVAKAKGYKSTGYKDAEVDGEIVRTHTTEAKDTLADAKLARIAELNTQAYQNLQPTDYYVTRKADIGTVIPKEVTTFRAQIRTDIITNEANIDALETYDEVIAYKIAFTPVASGQHY